MSTEQNDFMSSRSIINVVNIALEQEYQNIGKPLPDAR
jgi:hypothetical protein